MDTKWKNNRRIRSLFMILAILLVTAGNFFLFPIIGNNAEKEYIQEQKLETINEEFINELVHGSYVLYSENIDFSEEDSVWKYAASTIENWSNMFEYYRNMVDYYVKTEEAEQKNTSAKLEMLLREPEADELEELKELYCFYFVMKFDENGELSVNQVWDCNGRENEIIKKVLRGWRNNNFIEEASLQIEEAYFEEMSRQDTELMGNAKDSDEVISELKKSLETFPKNCQVLYGIPYEQTELTAVVGEEQFNRLHSYSISGASLLFTVSLVVLSGMVLLFTSKKIWKTDMEFTEKRKWYLGEAAIGGILFTICMHDTFVGINSSYMLQCGQGDPLWLITTGKLGSYMNLLELAMMVLVIYGIWCLSLWVIRPVFSLGIREYIRRYSLIYWLCMKLVRWLRGCWNKTKEEVAHVDFSDKTIKTIRKIVIINFIVLAVLSCFWFFGIFALLVYSVILFFVIKNQYQLVRKNYQSLKEATERIAQGDLQYEDTRDWGVFEPLKEEMAKIRSGFSRAVEEEVKSQRMKAELITNVSHDLKTPLTAITTYVELLKDETITREQRNSYIEILEKKSRRLKVLVEDLFEVSKATSNTIKLDLMEVDVVNLLKQVVVEHQERFTELGLSVKWKLPKEKVMLMLDNQKTYRIFENLFVNIEKYAMPNSRVFIDVTVTEHVQIVIRNMSAQELEMTGAEITERFVRGDASRTTEGSGLGLAIAKSFTEAQKGTFAVSIDGDLFKVILNWE